MAGSQYPQTTRSLLKTGLLLILYHYCICSVDKNHHLHRRWINPSTQLLASHDLKMILVLIKFNSRHSEKLKVVKIRSCSSFPRPFRILESGETTLFFLPGRLDTSSNTLPCSCELLCNDSSGTIVKTREAALFH